MDKYRNIQESIKHLLALSIEYKNKLEVVLLMRKRGPNEDPLTEGETSLVSEYFDEVEVQELISAFRKNNVYTTCFFNEIDFFNSAMNFEIPKNKERSLFLYTTGHSGKNRARKSLSSLFCDIVDFNTLNSPAYTDAINRHKYHQYLIIKDAGLPQPKSWFYCVKNGWISGKPSLGTEVIVKPIGESSSHGLDKNSKFEYKEDKDKYIIDKSRTLNQSLIIQEFIYGEEVEVGVINSKNKIALPPTILSKQEKIIIDSWLDYETIAAEKYYFKPASTLSSDIVSVTQEVALRTANILEHEGISRIDMRIDPKRGPLIIDVSTTPHLIGHSSIKFAFNILGLTESDIVSCLLATGLESNINHQPSTVGH